MASAKDSARPERAGKPGQAARLRRPRWAHTLPTAALASVAIATALAGCGGSSRDGAQASTRPTASQLDAQRSNTTPARSASRPSSRPASAHRDRASRSSMHASAQRRFQAAAQSVCETLIRGLEGRAPRGSSPGAGASSIYEAQQDAFRIEQAIHKLAELHPPSSVRARVGELVLGLRRLQILGLESVRAPHGEANALSSAIARAEQQASSAAIAAGLPACAHLQGLTVSTQATNVPGQPTAPGQPAVPGQPVPGQPTVPGQPVPGQPVPGQRAAPGQPSVHVEQNRRKP